MFSFIQSLILDRELYNLSMHYMYYNKRYSRIDRNLARHFVTLGAGLLSPTPVLCSQTITPFCISMLSTNQETGLEF